MGSITEAVAEAAKRLCGEDLAPSRAYIVYRAMGHHRSIKFKNYPALDEIHASDPARFDDMVAKTVAVLKHYRWSYQTFLKALHYHDPLKKAALE